MQDLKDSLCRYFTLLARYDEACRRATEYLRLAREALERERLRVERLIEIAGTPCMCGLLKNLCGPCYAQSWVWFNFHTHAYLRERILNAMGDITVSFKISGEFLTDHCRNLWAEGRSDLAIQTMMKSIIGMNEPTAMLICTGKRKLCGWNGKVTMKRDSAKKSASGLPLLSLEALLKQQHKERTQVELPSPRGLVSVGEQELEKIRWNQAISAPSSRMDQFLDATVSRMMAEDRQRSERPKPDKELVSLSGWIDRDGTFWPCCYMGHIDLAAKLLKGGEREAEKLGWIKVSNSEEGLVQRSWQGPDFVYCSDAPKGFTQAQLNTAASWCAKHKRELANWIKEVE